MKLRPGQDAVLSWPAGAADCRIVAAAGQFVLLRPLTLMSFTDSLPDQCTLTFLDGMIPMGFDGEVEFGPVPGELRFRLSDTDAGGERRTSVRLPVFAEVLVTSAGGAEMRGSLLDVSAGGLRFRDTGRHELGTVLRVHVQLPDGPAFTADGEVRLSEVGGVTALRFTQFHAGSPQDVGAWTVNQLRKSLAPA